MPDPNTVVPADDFPGRPNLMRDLLAQQERVARTENVVEMIAIERFRQINAEGWSPEHDDEHTDSELARAAACYALDERTMERRVDGDASNRTLVSGLVPVIWPWSIRWWKPCPDDRIRELVKAGALIVAEIERLQRKAAPPESAETKEDKA